MGWRRGERKDTKIEEDEEGIRARFPLLISFFCFYALSLLPRVFCSLFFPGIFSLSTVKPKLLHISVLQCFERDHLLHSKSSFFHYIKFFNGFAFLSTLQSSFLYVMRASFTYPSSRGNKALLSPYSLPFPGLHTLH